LKNQGAEPRHHSRAKLRLAMRCISATRAEHWPRLTVAYPEMWRVHQPDGWISDMARLEWAKEGAIRTVLAELNRKENVGAG
jgi:hypothetical protein